MVPKRSQIRGIFMPLLLSALGEGRTALKPGLGRRVLYRVVGDLDWRHGSLPLLAVAIVRRPSMKNLQRDRGLKGGIQFRSPLLDHGVVGASTEAEALAGVAGECREESLCLLPPSSKGFRCKRDTFENFSPPVLG